MNGGSDPFSADGPASGPTHVSAFSDVSITGPWPPLAPSSDRISARMRTFPRRDTSPERALRSALHSRGLRYRVCMPVPGMRRRTIDVAFTRAKVAVFIDGCYWHGCPDHHRLPRANQAWWQEKIRRNRLRDAQTTQHLALLGWHVMRHWEHEDLGDVADNVERIVRTAQRASHDVR